MLGFSNLQRHNLKLVLAALTVSYPAVALRAEECLPYRGLGQPLASLPLNSSGLAISSDWAFVGMGSQGMFVIDVSDPLAPAIRDTVDTPGSAAGVAASGNYAFVADGLSGMQVVDVTSPSSASIVASAGTPGTAMGIAISAGLAYIADNAFGLRIIDVSDPVNPSPVGGVVTTYPVERVVVSGTHAFLTSVAGVYIVDVSSPAAPIVVGLAGAVGAGGCAVMGDHLYAAWLDGLSIYDVSNPATPTPVGGIASLLPGKGITVVGDRAFMTTDFGVLVFDVSVPSSPQARGGIATFYTPNTEIVLAGDRAFVVGSEFRTFRIPGPVSPPLIGVLNTPGTANDVAVQGTIAYVADGSAGLQVVDVQNPAAPGIIGNLDTPGTAQAVVVEGHYAYVADSNSLQIVDVTDPAMPTTAGSLPGLSVALDIALAWPDGYVATGTGLKIVDVSNPSIPAIIASVSTLATAVAVSGAMVYFASGNLFAVDVSDPASPVVLGTAFTHTASAVLVAGNHAYVGDDSHGHFFVFDITNPASISNDLTTFAGGSGLARVGDRVFGASRRWGAWSIDITSPASPVPSTGLDLQRPTAGVAVANGVAYVAALDAGLEIYPAPCPNPTSVNDHDDVAATPLGYFEVAPNPARRSTTFQFEVSPQSTVDLQVFDVAGRLVRQFSRLASTAGRQRVVWDGRDDRGREVPAGVYFARLIGPATARTCRVSILR